MAEQQPKKINRGIIIMAAIGSVLFSLLLYVGFVAFFEYLDSSTISDGFKTWLVFGAFAVLLMGPTIIVALIVVPILKRSQKR